MCPVCRARFRGSRECSRCGADLRIIMGLAAAAWRLRKAARRALAENNFERAGALAAQAEALSGTSGGKKLVGLARLLAACGGTVEFPPPVEALPDDGLRFTPDAARSSDRFWTPVEPAYNRPELQHSGEPLPLRPMPVDRSVSSRKDTIPLP